MHFCFLILKFHLHPKHHNGMNCLSNFYLFVLSNRSDRVAKEFCCGIKKSKRKKEMRKTCILSDTSSCDCETRKKHKTKGHTKKWVRLNLNLLQVWSFKSSAMCPIVILDEKFFLLIVCHHTPSNQKT